MAQIDLVAEEMYNAANVEVGLVADCAPAVDQIAEALEGRQLKSKDSGWLTKLTEQASKNRAALDEMMASDSVPISPYRLLRDVRDSLPRDATISVDGEITLGVGRLVLPSYLSRHRLNSGTTACMGTGVPYAIGAKLARPNQTSIGVLGDYAFGASGMEVETAARVGANAVFVIVNNGGISGRGSQRRTFGDEAPLISGLLQPATRRWRRWSTALPPGGRPGGDPSDNRTRDRLRSRRRRQCDGRHRGRRPARRRVFVSRLDDCVLGRARSCTPPPPFPERTVPMSSRYPRRRRTRLESMAYAEPSAICSITITTARRLPVFADGSLATSCADLLVRGANDSDVKLHAFCLMPDHAHLLVSPSIDVSIIEFVRRFKGLSTRLWWIWSIVDRCGSRGFTIIFCARMKILVGPWSTSSTIQ